MKIADLVEILQLAQVDPAYYAIGDTADDALCLLPDASVWRVFICERGQRSEERAFAAETDACVHFLKRVLQLSR